MKARPLAKPNTKLPVWKAASQLTAEELRHVARDFGDPDAKVHLGRGSDLQAVDQRLILAEIAAGDIAYLLRFHGIRNRPGKDNASVHGPYGDLRVGRGLTENALETTEMVLNIDLALEQDVFLLVHREQGRGAAATAEHVDQRRRVGLHVRDLGVGDEHSRRRTRQPDQPALPNSSGKSRSGATTRAVVAGAAAATVR